MQFKYCFYLKMLNNCKTNIQLTTDYICVIILWLQIYQNIDVIIKEDFNDNNNNTKKYNTKIYSAHLKLCIIDLIK